MTEAHRKANGMAKRLVLRQIRRGTALEAGWEELLHQLRPALGASLFKAAAQLPITDSLAKYTAEYAYLLGRDRPGKEVKGLWFGLVEFGRRGSINDTEWTPYIAGARAYIAGDSNWCVDPVWMPSECYAPNECMQRLSDLRKRYRSRHWLIEVALIEPLNMLMGACFVRSASPEVLLGKTPSRGVGCGFDDGDHWSLGVIRKGGFKVAIK